jgi:hypothetical protein
MKSFYALAGKTYQVIKIKFRLPGDGFNPRLVILIFAVNILFFSLLQGRDTEHVDRFNYILVSGESNVNEFEIVWEESHNLSMLKGHEDNDLLKLSIPFKNFKAKNSYILKDFLDLVEAESYPEMLISIPEEYFGTMRSTENIMNLEILISIAGRENSYLIPCAVGKSSSGLLHISGSKQLNLTDFGIMPPVKLQGLIKVKNEIRVNFGFIITFNEPKYNLVKH